MKRQTAKERMLSYDQQELISLFKKHIKSGKSVGSFFNKEIGFSASVYSVNQYEMREFREYYRKAVKRYLKRKRTKRKITD